MPVSLFPHILSEKRSQELHRFAVPQQLRHIVEAVISIPAELFPHTGPSFNDGRPVMVFQPREAGYITVKHGNKQYTMREAWISGPYIGRADILQDAKEGAWLLVLFNPFYFFRLFRLDPFVLRSKPCYGLPELLYERGRILLEKVRQAFTTEDKVVAIMAFFTRISKGIGVDHTQQQVLAFIEQVKGRTTVAALADHFKVNYKFLERQLKAGLGITPKECCNLQRFINAYVALAHGERDLMGIALDHGYYDQNHFTKDFNRFTGLSPLKYFNNA